MADVHAARDWAVHADNDITRLTNAIRSVRQVAESIIASGTDDLATLWDLHTALAASRPPSLEAAWADLASQVRTLQSAVEARRYALVKSVAGGYVLGFRDNDTAFAVRANRLVEQAGPFNAADAFVREVQTSGRRVLFVEDPACVSRPAAELLQLGDRVGGETCYVLLAEPLAEVVTELIQASVMDLGPEYPDDNVALTIAAVLYPEFVTNPGLGTHPAVVALDTARRCRV